MRMSSKTWGLDIGSTGIKAVEVTRTWKGSRVTHYGFFPFSSKGKDDLRREKLRLLAETIFPRVKSNGEDLIVPFASHRTMVHRVVLPFHDRKKNEQVLKFELEPLLPFPVEGIVADFYASDEQKPTGSLAFAVQKEVLGETVALVKESGLDPETVIPESLALFSLVRRLGLTSGTTSSLLDLGQEKATLIVWTNDRLALVRSIPGAGGAGPNSEAAAILFSPTTGGRSAQGKDHPKVEVETESAPLGRICEEVKRTFLSYQYSPEGNPVENLYLSGGGSLQPGVEKIIGDRLQKSVSLLDLGADSNFFPDYPRETGPVLAVAAGAALGGASTERLNLRKEEFASSHKAEKTKSRMKFLVAYGIILAVLGFGSLLTDLFLQERRYRDLKGEVKKEFLLAMPGVKKVVNEVQQLKAAVREEKTRLNSLGGISGSGSPLEIIREISLMTEPAWKMRVTELLLQPESVEVNGEADSFDAVNQLKSKLDRSSQYQEVQLKTARASGLENVIEFKLQMKRRN